MNYSSDQKAMFHLGRMLNAVAYIQKDKNKNVLEKVNFSGLDKSDILRLRNSLMEKAQQYNKVEKVIFSDANFSDGHHGAHGVGWHGTAWGTVCVFYRRGCRCF